MKQLDIFSENLCSECPYFKSYARCNYGKCRKKWPGFVNKYISMNSNCSEMEKRIRIHDEIEKEIKRYHEQ